MNTQRVVKALGSLFRMVEAGERGYAVAASNVSNRALKILFQTFAQQRANFKEELMAEIQQLGGRVHGNSSFLGIVHRGRIDIFAALTIGAENVEKVILKEVMIGERVALRAYEKTLNQDLPPSTREIVLRQFEQVRSVVDLVRLLRGRKGKQMVVRLYDSKADAEKAVQALKKTGIHENEIEMKNLNPEKGMELYVGRGTTILETIISGAVGGAIWGTVAGILAAIGIFQMGSFGMGNISPANLQFLAAISLLGLVAGGSFIGGMIGLFIGWGIEGADRYVNTYSFKDGQILMRAIVDRSVASRVWRIMNQVAMESRTLRVSANPV